ncbi:hypothetical protein HUJ04_000904 [Dendroctonus ponderosae]|nr:hypothetical protein HUJ04_000904 [Dendroctonus ponderosae]
MFKMKVQKLIDAFTEISVSNNAISFTPGTSVLNKLNPMNIYYRNTQLQIHQRAALAQGNTVGLSASLSEIVTNKQI